MLSTRPPPSGGRLHRPLEALPDQSMRYERSVAEPSLGRGENEGLEEVAVCGARPGGGSPH